MFNYNFILNPVIQAFLAGLFTFFITTLGSATVFLFKKINKIVMDSMLAISAGIMLAASFFSLLNPAIERAEKLKMIVWLVILTGFLSGGIVLLISDKFLKIKVKNNNTKSLKRCIMLFTSITLHNIPEGLAVGIAFGSIKYHLADANLTNAFLLALAIGLQNFPEGSAISLPMRRENYSRIKSFLWGSMSASVEPIFAIVGAILVLKIQVILPFILAFTAGAMIFVTVLELIPECQTNKKKGLMTLFIMIGFAVMMVLELVL